MRPFQIPFLLLGLALTACSGDPAPAAAKAPGTPPVSIGAAADTPATAPEVSPGDGKANPGNNAAVGGGTETGLPPEAQQHSSR